MRPQSTSVISACLVQMFQQQKQQRALLTAFTDADDVGNSELAY